MREAVAALLDATGTVVIAYFLALNSFYALLLLLSVPELRANVHLARHSLLHRLLGGDVLPPISVLAPAYNEERTIVDSVQAFLTLTYPRHEVVVVNDGSGDDTIGALRTAYDLYEVPPAFEVSIPTEPVRAYYRSRVNSKLLVVDKENGGKADALNAGLNAARYPWVIAVDADTLIEEDALVRVTRPLLLGQDVAGVGATVRVVNGCTVEHGRVTATAIDRRWLPRVQVVEYLRAFLFGRLGWNRLGGNLIVAGAFGLFRRSYLRAIGGYSRESVTEDMEIVIRLRRSLAEQGIAASLPFVPDPVAWTEVPSTLRVLGRQRERWHRGLVTTLWRHRDVLFNPRYGRMGLLAFPYYVFGEMLAPVMEGLGIVLAVLGLATGLVDVRYAVLFFAAAAGYGMLLSMWAVVLQEIAFPRYQRRRDLVAMLLATLTENFGLRQLTVWFRLQGFWRALRGVHTWGAMERQGFRPPPVRHGTD